jgi:hypothetical protein
MHKFNSADELKHGILDMLGFQRPSSKADSLVKITHGSIFKDKVHVRIRLEGMNQVDDVGVITKAIVAVKLNQIIVAKVIWTSRVDRWF